MLNVNSDEYPTPKDEYGMLKAEQRNNYNQRFLVPIAMPLIIALLTIFHKSNIDAKFVVLFLFITYVFSLILSFHIWYLAHKQITNAMLMQYFSHVLEPQKKSCNRWNGWQNSEGEYKKLFYKLMNRINKNKIINLKGTPNSFLKKQTNTYSIKKAFEYRWDYLITYYSHFLFLIFYWIFTLMLIFSYWLNISFLHFDKFSNKFITIPGYLPLLICLLTCTVIYSFSVFLHRPSDVYRKGRQYSSDLWKLSQHSLNNPYFLLRKEYYGGILYDVKKGMISEHLTKIEYELLKEKAKKRNKAPQNMASEKIEKLNEMGIVENLKLIEPLPEIKDNLSAPIIVYMHLTYDCNLSCTYCMYDKEKNIKNELSEEKIRTIFQEMEHIGCMALRLTGGEPTTREDLADIILLAKQYHFYVSLNTNGVSSNKKWEELLHAGLDEIIISIDGTKEHHNTYRNSKKVKDSYTDAISTLKFFSTKEIKKSIKMTVSKEFCSQSEEDIKKEIGKIHTLAKDNNACLSINPMRNTRNKKVTIPNRENYVKLTRIIEGINRIIEGINKTTPKESYKIRNYNYKQPNNKKWAPFDRSTCAAGAYGMAILPDGAGIPCGHAIDCFRTEPNTIIKMWHSKEFNNFRRDFTSEINCSRCDKYMNTCIGACKAVALGDESKIIDDKYCIGIRETTQELDTEENVIA